ncbi:MAG: flagellar protein export ATPase FliI [Hyphomicrobiaceae bacterium]|nr:flagellar protein export ATPase FliI [Hyphomicrobiaceae bacterium]
MQLTQASHSDTESADVGPLTRLARLFAPHRDGLPLRRQGGRVCEVTMSHVNVSGLQRHVELGSCVEVETTAGPATGEVIAIHADVATIKLFGASTRLSLGATAWLRDELSISPTPHWLGRVVNALGEPIDGLGPLHPGAEPLPLDREPIAAMELDRVRVPIATGIRVIDLFTPICAGQRIGIFAGAGVGKTTTISMLARARGFDTIVVALVAERGREVREFIEDAIGTNRPRTLTVVSSSSESPMMRKLSAKTAMTAAEYFRDRGDKVLLILDSLTRFAHAQREIALAAGEPPVARGYAPSVFIELPRLLERAGPGRPGSGSITGVFSVLVDGDDHNEPVADAIRGILDGHIVLDRNIADQGRYPAIDPLSSISRLALQAWSREEAELIRRLKTMIARYEESRDLRALGAYKPGVDPELDQAVAVTPLLYRAMLQGPEDSMTENAFGALASLLAGLRNSPTAKPPAEQSIAAARGNV